MRKSQSSLLFKSSLMSQRQTLPDLIQKIGMRFATQYELTTQNNIQSNPGQLELIRIQEKYKWKCEELDRTRQSIEREHKTLDDRKNQLKRGEKEMRILTNLIEEKLIQLHSQEQQFRERVQSFEQKEKDREQQFILLQQQLEEQSNQLNIEKNKLLMREKTIKEKEYLIELKSKEIEQYLSRLKYYTSNTNQKENYYHQQIDNINLHLQTILEHEMSIKNIEQQMSLQVNSLEKAEQNLFEKLQKCKQSEQIFDQQELKIQVSEDLINRKLEWDQKQIVSAKNSKASQFNFENSRMEISHFVYSALSQNH
ncbi:unnamed protein product (macronuclear) [Paramecium tetraurelia]|uniref:Uncharacterized protein n=1 Tax=Paramecium tetraurelia TaxID=5888 RepID=A0DB32_PARTE|nr:uncharacterized protein GSPATT00015143001 [Paramecium tetraurelia]CAK80249.1 unnamed protein product [Paramecium tetraurelia]|eukprot:XP_001447646.1 hypothetical protein (macronuclear) [Paramecium tetraurelia strain d4-2]